MLCDLYFLSFFGILLLVKISYNIFTASFCSSVGWYAAIAWRRNYCFAWRRFKNDSFLGRPPRYSVSARRRIFTLFVKSYGCKSLCCVAYEESLRVLSNTTYLPEALCDDHGKRELTLNFLFTKWHISLQSLQLAAGSLGSRLSWHCTKARWLALSAMPRWVFRLGNQHVLRQLPQCGTCGPAAICFSHTLCRQEKALTVAN